MNKFKDSKETLIQRMLRLTDGFCSAPYYKGFFNNYYIRRKAENLTTYQNEIEYITFRMGLIIIKKRS